MDQVTESIADLYREHGPALLRYLRRLAGPRRAEDLLQDTFLQALASARRRPAIRSPRAWLFGIARHVAYSAIRREGQRADERATAEALPRQETRDPRLDAMREAIDRLPRESREALWLRLNDELSYEEIAEALAVPVGTVRSRLHYAVRRLRTMLITETDEVSHGQAD